MKPLDSRTFDRLIGKRIALIGMSGVGKTHLSRLLRDTGRWYHYSVDYRLGKAYLASHIDDDLRARAMQDPVLGPLLLADALTLRAKFAIDNLDVMSGYLGKIGDPRKGGLTRAEFIERQRIHRNAEQAAMQDTASFVRRSETVYGYPSFTCDTSGSFCSVVDPWDPNDPILSDLAATHIIVYLEAGTEDEERLIARFKHRPKPIYYSDAFFSQCERDYLGEDKNWDTVDPDAFAIWAYERLLTFRRPRYEAIADRWGYRVRAEELARVSSEQEILDVLRAHIS